MIEEGNAIAVCPEVLAGLPTPRESCEIQKNANTYSVRSKSGKNFTDAFINGANETLKICLGNNINKAILRSNSPSCGFGKVYDGKFNGTLIRGNGLTADLLFKNGIKVFTDENYLDELRKSK